MEKTKTMLNYEQETGNQSTRFVTDGIHSYGSIEVWHYEYINWLEAKATAYDRLMSGGKKTPKEWANFLGWYIVKDLDGSWHGFEKKPTIIKEFMFWANPRGGKFFEIPSEFWKDIEYEGKWEDSLTFPDGLEAK